MFLRLRHRPRRHEDAKITWLPSCLGAFVAMLITASVFPAAQHPAGDYFVFAGSYTNPTPTTTSASKGIYSFRFDSKTGTLGPIGLAAESVNPVHLWAHPNGKFLYAANWETGDKVVGDTVSAFAIDHKTGKLNLLNKVSAYGDRANQVVVDPSGKVAITVTYNSGTVTA